MYFYLLLKKIANKTKSNSIFYKLFKSNKSINLDESSLIKARQELESFSQNPGINEISCYTENNITELVDLQFIIPAYNAEAYIEACINSIINKKTKYTYRITVINDGSTDSTGELLKQYSKNNNIEIITQENRGFSGARNRGLENLVGRYVYFIDSDDLMGDFNALLDKAFETNADVVRGGYDVMNNDGVVYETRRMKSGILTPSYGIHGTPWAKIIKASCIKNFRLPENFWYEDSVFESVLAENIHSAVGVDCISYYYRQNPTGISAISTMKKKSIDSFWIQEQIFRDRQNLGYSITQDYYEFSLKMVRITFSRTIRMPLRIKKSIFVLTVDFINKNFKGFHTSNKEFIDLENALKNANWRSYFSFCLFK